MNQKELCEWLRNNSSGIYRTAADAAEEIERLQAENERLKRDIQDYESEFAV